MDRLNPGNIIVKYDTEVCGEYKSLKKAINAIKNHHFVKQNPEEVGDFEFFLVCKTSDRKINGNYVQRLGRILRSLKDSS